VLAAVPAGWDELPGMDATEGDESYRANFGRRTHLSVLPSFSNAGSADTRAAFKVTASIAAKLSA